jgi:hypothetical protein
VQGVRYREDLPVLGEDVVDVVGEGELAGARRVGHQVVVVDEIVAAEGDEHQRAVHQPGRLLRADQRAQPLLVLLEVEQLLRDVDDVGLIATSNTIPSIISSASDQPN